MKKEDEQRRMNPVINLRPPHMHTCASIPTHICAYTYAKMLIYICISQEKGKAKAKSMIIEFQIWSIWIVRPIGATKGKLKCLDTWDVYSHSQQWPARHCFLHWPLTKYYSLNQISPSRCTNNSRCKEPSRRRWVSCRKGKHVFKLLVGKWMLWSYPRTELVSMRDT